MGNEAGCECADGFEEDSTYAADRGDGAINGKCSRIDPCNPAVGDGYDCSAIIDSSCVTADDFNGACSCNENFLPYELDDDSEHKNYTKFVEKEYFENSADIECVHNSPCEETPCSSEEKKECKVLSVQSMPTAFCKCIAGYEDKNRLLNRILAENTEQLKCEDMGECEAETHDCHADATCTNNSGSYECECNAGFTGDGKDCKDIDECKATENPCKEANKTKCNNSAGTYECSCDDGYEQKDDAKKCTDIDECKATENPCKDANKTKCNNSPGKYECSCDDGFLENTNDDSKEDKPCIACSGPGAVESDGQCTCTDDENALLEGSTCTCNALYEDKEGTCVLLPITNVEDIVCDSDAICQDFSAKCSEGKCACDISINAVAEAKDPAEEHSSGLKLTNACVIKTDCEIFEMKTPCGDNSNCVVGDDNEAGCECADGFEEDSTYAADRGDGPING